MGLLDDGLLSQVGGGYCIPISQSFLFLSCYVLVALFPGFLGR